MEARRSPAYWAARYRADSRLCDWYMSYEGQFRDVLREVILGGVSSNESPLQDVRYVNQTLHSLASKLYLCDIVQF